MVMMDVFLAGDDSIEFPGERATLCKINRCQATFLTRVNNAHAVFCPPHYGHGTEISQ